MAESRGSQDRGYHMFDELFIPLLMNFLSYLVASENADPNSKTNGRQIPGARNTSRHNRISTYIADDAGGL